MKVVFIGGGNMAGAMLGGLLAQGWTAAELGAVDPDPARRAQLTADYGIATFDPVEPLPAAPTVVLAVKPQQLAQVARARAGELAGRLVISIAAGVRMADLDRWLDGGARLIRVMPNTPALVRAGISGAWLGPRADRSDRASADALLAAIGDVVWVEQEADIDAVTAISGSGPAYVFYLLDALTEAATAQGFAAETARRLAYATFDGAVRLAQASPESAAVLRQRVTSKGGTTEAALARLEAREVRAAIVEAAAAAASRAAELADQLGQS
ncbi:pyrroline-5-carboxylate reductase [Chitinimonas lacunae]|uniref:Pyrroline-5-carboxylate reductase n=1 Tax=Chitinimonas lacunae TaxID=1963018 RepID=A0ABV8MVX8_9NEIS